MIAVGDNWKGKAATLLRLCADALDGGSSAVAATSKPDKLLIGLTALVRVVGPAARIVEGKGTFADDMQLANSVMDEIALFAPGTAPVIADIEMAEAAFAWLVGVLRSGPIRITGGVPPGYVPGPGPYRGR